MACNSDIPLRLRSATIWPSNASHEYSRRWRGIWTRGVFISWMGFTPEGLTAFGKGKRVICVSGYDLYHSLSHGIPLPDLLDAKTRHAAETGEPYAEFDRLYALKNKQFGTLK